MLKDASHRDIGGWGLFTKADIKRIEEVVNKIDYGKFVKERQGQIA